MVPSLLINTRDSAPDIFVMAVIISSITSLLRLPLVFNDLCKFLSSDDIVFSSLVILDFISTAIFLKTVLYVSSSSQSELYLRPGSALTSATSLIILELGCLLILLKPRHLLSTEPFINLFLFVSVGEKDALTSDL